jgi:DNA-directed RNA polymerase subunit K/omega
MPEKLGKMNKSKKTKINVIDNEKKSLKKIDVFDGVLDETSQNGGIIDKSDEEDNIYNENNSEISSESEESEYEENIEENNEDIENEDNLGDGGNEIDDEDKSMESDSDVTEEEEVEAEAEVIEDGEGDGCLYKFAVKKNVDNDSDDEYDDEENFDDDNKIYDIIVESSKRVTDPILYMFERVRLLAVRAKQLSRGAKPMLLNVDNLTPKEIAKKELEEKMIPLIVVRTLPNGKKEHWKLKELEIVN